ncbi:acyl-CoA thioesterase [Desulfallas sp. Bu1-1]|uniref:acyl-CoA thioesterase n=1 Tax=Desulfallas sp. Bu1-1 TaxID=2787620 RepID=UPI00189D485A|nr:acyl-CoA thioesterase [Desulfallas sp. Bu1-1]MBF7084298.1 acyl-CoA thioesterase [Desulfallas sp. Bu1-1]
MGYQYRVSFSDIDYGRILFYGKVYSIVEKASEEFYLEHGIDLRDLIGKRHIGVPLVESRCQYISPMKYLDVVNVDLGAVDLTRKGFRLLFNLSVLPEGRLAAAGYLKFRFVNTKEFKGIEIPHEIEKLFSKLVTLEPLFDPFQVQK